MLLATALACLWDNAQQTFAVQNKPAAVAQKPSRHFFVSGIGQKKTVDAAKIWRRRNVVKTEANDIRKWIAQFY